MVESEEGDPWPCPRLPGALAIKLFPGSVVQHIPKQDLRLRLPTDRAHLHLHFWELFQQKNHPSISPANPPSGSAPASFVLLVPYLSTSWPAKFCTKNTLPRIIIQNLLDR